MPGPERSAAGWVDLEATANTRDLAGLPAVDGRRVAPRRLLRSDHLGGLTAGDVRRLVQEYDVRTVVDLRADDEVDGEQRNPLLDVPGVAGHRVPLLTRALTAPADRPEESKLAALAGRGSQDRELATYRRFLAERPDALVTALRLIASSPGAALVHCTVGKDRTGLVIAFALGEVGVDRTRILADYAASAERIDAVFARLSHSPVYGPLIVGRDPRRYAPRPEMLEALLAELDGEFPAAASGPGGWLRAHGWTDGDAAELAARLCA